VRKRTKILQKYCGMLGGGDPSETGGPLSNVLGGEDG